MRLIGLTGGIASGKSTVSTLFQELGAFVIDTDKIARAVVEPGEAAYFDVIAAFGDSIVAPDGTIDRLKLGGIVFQDKDSRVILEKITHPPIEAKVNQLIQSAQKRSCPIVILDVPLLFESGWDKRVDEVWVVAVDETTQLQRLINRNNFSEQEAMARIKAQLPLADKIRRANQVIDNSGDLSQLQTEVLRVWTQAVQ
jgi:dephospho-CoA kinase